MGLFAHRTKGGERKQQFLTVEEAVDKPSAGVGDASTPDSNPGRNFAVVIIDFT